MNASELNIGTHIRRLRLQQRRTQQEIATACGFTKSLLSKIESNTVTPPMATLIKIARALGTTVSALMEADGHAGTVHTTAPEALAGIVKTERGYWIYPFATHRKNKRIQPFLMVARKGEVKEHHLVHEGEEFIYVVEGQMKVQVGRAEYRVGAGDSLYFSSTEEHQVIPVSNKVTYLNFFI